MAENKIAKDKSSELPEKNKVRQLFVFQNQEYDLNNLTDEQIVYLKQFPDEVPFVK